MEYLVPDVFHKTLPTYWLAASNYLIYTAGYSDKYAFCYKWDIF